MHEYGFFLSIFFLKWNSNDLSKLLFFITGSSQFPVNSFIEYQDNGNTITIAPGGEKIGFVLLILVLICFVCQNMKTKKK